MRVMIARFGGLTTKMCLRLYTNFSGWHRWHRWNLPISPAAEVSPVRLTLQSLVFGEIIWWFDEVLREIFIVLSCNSHLSWSCSPSTCRSIPSGEWPGPEIRKIWQNSDPHCIQGFVLILSRHSFSKAYLWHSQTVIQPCMWFLHDGTGYAMCCLAHR